ncbi:guanylate-binding protein 2 isoform X2 [Amia ocellicauda]|uniref:guanylate-binding protein 2 isoform X2 n=1 Tax=Amia ocellicauda TaxID=2972642 RepID=UPI0034647CCD
MAARSPWETPMPLIVSGPDLCLRVDMDTVERLSRITAAVSVVAVVGKYRTGKSFLLNKLAGASAEKGAGFELGCTVQSKTKGLWILPIPHPTKPNHTILLVDTEGLGDIEKGSRDHDCWIFVLAVLLSSTLIFNTTGTLSNEGFEQLNFVSNMTEHIRSRVHSSPDEVGQDFEQFFPRLVVCVRDFSLRLELDGEAVSSDQYLEHCLSSRKTGKSREARDYNQLRENLQDFFKERRCFTFPMPAPEDRLSDLEQADSEELSEVFMERLQELMEHVFTAAHPKTLEGVALNGKAWAGLAVEYTKAIDSREVPCIESSLSLVVRRVNEDAKSDSVFLYTSAMKSTLSRLPVPVAQLAHTHQDSATAALRNFAEKCLLDRDNECAKELGVFLEKQLQEWSRRNDSESEMFCRDLLKEERKPRRNFLKPGGHQDFVRMVESVRQAYQDTPNKGPKAEEVLSRFLSEVQSDEEEILMVDSSLSEMEKLKSRQETDRKVLEQENRVLKEKMQFMETSFESAMKQNEN